MKEIKNVEEFNSFIEENKTSGEVGVMVYSAPWCVPCRTLTPILETISEETGVNIIKVLVDDFPEQTAEYGVRGVPAMFFIKNGVVQERTSGMQSKETIIEILKKY